MGDKTAIEWTEATWPIVQGCDYDSPGCANCYAVPLIWRLAHNPDPKISGPLKGLVAEQDRRVYGKVHHWTGKIALREDRLDWPLKWRRGRKIFVPSHGDLFHEDVPDSFVDKVFEVMASTGHHQYQVLTKRSGRLRDYIARSQWGAYAANVWLGVSVEDRKRLYRVKHLRDTPAAVRFLSIEPLLEDLGEINLAGIHWVIIGGESGAYARPFHPEWARNIIVQCRAAEVPVFVKQMGANIEIGQGDQLWRYVDQPHVSTISGSVHLRDRKGGDMAEWPTDLRVREYPAP